MKQTALQLTLREMHALLSSSRMWGGMAIAVLILGMSGPFQTFAFLPLGPRLAYWATMGIATFSVGSFFGTWSAHFTSTWNIHAVFRFMTIGFASGFPVAVTVIAINSIALGFSPTDIGDMLNLAFYSIGISMGIAGLFEMFNRKSSEQDAKVEPPKILNRLPIEKRGELISMSVQDHYVEIVTSRGKHLTLVRLGDAINETEGTDGFQIHRSHWVALNAIKSVSRQNGKAIVRTRNDGELPVSRTYIKSLKEAGLLV